MVETVLVFSHVALSLLVIVLVLMHSGRDSGLGSVGGGSSSSGQHIMERNLDRITVFISILFFATTISLIHLFE